MIRKVMPEMGEDETDAMGMGEPHECPVDADE